MKRIDANIILRYLLDDHPNLSGKAADILETQNVFAAFEVLCEVVYVLGGVYGVDREKIGSNLETLMRFPNVSTDDPNVLSRALIKYADGKIDFVDALLYAYSVVKGDEIETFDNQLRRLVNGPSQKKGR